MNRRPDILIVQPDVAEQTLALLARHDLSDVPLDIRLAITDVISSSLMHRKGDAKKSKAPNTRRARPTRLLRSALTHAEKWAHYLAVPSSHADSVSKHCTAVNLALDDMRVVVELQLALDAASLPAIRVQIRSCAIEPAALTTLIVALRSLLEAGPVPQGRSQGPISRIARLSCLAWLAKPRKRTFTWQDDSVLAGPLPAFIRDFLRTANLRCPSDAQLKQVILDARAWARSDGSALSSQKLPTSPT